MRKVVSIVVTYNRKEQLRRNLMKLLSQTVKCDVIIVDNASVDGTGDMIAAEFSKTVQYYNTGKNLGGAGGFAFGLQKAMEAGYPYAWLMDDDVVPEPDSLAMLLWADKKLGGNWGMLSSVAKWSDGSICKANRQKKSLFRFVRDRELSTQKLIRVQMVSMVSMLVKTDVVREIGLPKAEYFIWTDDYDFSGRVAEKYPVYIVTPSVVVHEMKENRKADIAMASGERLNRYQYLYRNDVNCYRRFGLYGWIYIVSKNLYTTGKVLIHSKNETRNKVAVIWKGFMEGLFFQPEIKRCIEQK